MPERSWEDLPEHGDAPNRFDVGGLGARLFGGPSATLYGDPGIPAPTDWDSKEIPSLTAGDMTGVGGGEHDYGDAPHEAGSMVRPTEVASAATGEHNQPQRACKQPFGGTPAPTHPAYLRRSGHRTCGLW